jgi:hypothetical protein
MAIVVGHVLTSMTGSFSPTEREHSVTGRHPPGNMPCGGRVGGRPVQGSTRTGGWLTLLASHASASRASVDPLRTLAASWEQALARLFERRGRETMRRQGGPCSARTVCMAASRVSTVRAIRGPKNVFQISLRSGTLMPKARSRFPKKMRHFKSRKAF